MNPIKTWNLFQIPDRKFHLLSYRIQNKLPQLDELQKIRPQIMDINERRRIIQKEIGHLLESADVCGRTCFWCCTGGLFHPHYPYTSIDYVLQLFSERPIKEIREREKPDSFFIFAFNKFKNMLSTDDSWRNSKNPPHCPYLKDTGCEFLPEDRPIYCIIFTCPILRQALPNDDLIKMGVMIKELVSLVKEVDELINLR